MMLDLTNGMYCTVFQQISLLHKKKCFCQWGQQQNSLAAIGITGSSYGWMNNPPLK